MLLLLLVANAGCSKGKNNTPGENSAKIIVHRLQGKQQWVSAEKLMRNGEDNVEVTGGACDFC